MLSDRGQSLDDIARRKVGPTFQMGKKFLGKHAGSRKMLEPRFSVPMCLTPSLLPWNQTTQRSREEGPKEVPKGPKWGLEMEEQFTYQMLILK